MSRPSIALVVVALALLAVGAAGAVSLEDASATTPVVGTTPGEPNHLAMNDSEIQRSNVTTPDLDVGAAISADSSAIQSSYAAARFEVAYENATTEEARVRVVDRFVSQFRNTTTNLEDRGRANIEAYARGAVSTDGFLSERARIQLQADRTRQAISDVTDRLPRRLSSDFNDVNGRLETVQGPISDSVARGVLGDGTGQSVYLEASGSGYTMATISAGEYRRETYLDDDRYPEEPDQFTANGTNGLSTAETRALELYPWVRENQADVSSTFPRGEGIYRVNKGFPGGEMSVYLSGGTTDVFREYQTRTLQSFNTTEAVNRTENSVRLTVNRTFETGPAEIRLHDTATNTPVNGTVEIGTRDPVWLGDDGRLWIVEPRGDVQLNATAGTTRFSTSLSGF